MLEALPLGIGYAHHQVRRDAVGVAKKKMSYDGRRAPAVEFCTVLHILLTLSSGPEVMQHSQKDLNQEVHQAVGTVMSDYRQW